MNRSFVLASLAIVLTLELNAQQRLVPGDTLADLELNNVANYTSSKMKFSDFTGKLIILDFWGPTCMSCIQAFPKTDSLQKLFKDRIQFVLVNREDKDSTLRFFADHPKVTMPRVPLITGDSLLHQLFDHIGDPYHVWIDSDRIVRYTTNGYNATVQNINQFLTQGNLQLKNRTFIPYKETLVDQKWEESMEYRSILSRCIDSIFLESPIHKNGFIHITFSCYSIASLYREAFSENGTFDFKRPGRLQVEIEDPFPYIKPKGYQVYDDWKRNYSYNYELVVPKRQEKEVYRMMREDLDRYFHLKAQIEKRSVRCLVLVRTTTKDQLHTKGGVPKDEFYKAWIKMTHFDSTRFMRNLPYERFSKRFSSIMENTLGIPFADATGYKGNIDIQLSGKTLDQLDLPALRRELKKYGLGLVEQQRLLPVLVLKKDDKKRNH